MMVNSEWSIVNVENAFYVPDGIATIKHRCVALLY